MPRKMPQREPRKPKPKRLKLNITEKSKWKQIIREVEKVEAPVNLLRGITVNLVNDQQVEIDIQELLTRGYSPEELESEINDQLEELDNVIRDVDFYISIENVAKAVQPATDIILKDL